MDDPVDQRDEGERPAADSRRVPRALAWTVGAGLLIAAVVTALRVLPTSGRAALDALREPDPVLLTLLPLLVLLNLLLTGEIFHRLGRRFVTIGRTEDLAVVSALTLANYLPFRPGTLLRVGYFRGRHRVPVGATVRILAEAYSVTAVLILLLLLLLLAAAALGAGALPAWLAAFAVTAAAALHPRWRLLGTVALLRLVEILAGAVRIHVAFALVGEPVDFTVASAVAVAGLATQLVPLVGNGLGLREWATGLLAGLLVGMPLGIALAAELLVRMVELLVVVPAGILGAAALKRHDGSAGSG